MPEARRVILFDSYASAHPDLFTNLDLPVVMDAEVFTEGAATGAVVLAEKAVTWVQKLLVQAKPDEVPPVFYA